MISIVVAHASNRAIGRDGGLPWQLPTDLRRFKEMTTGRTVLMGRRTFESLPERFRPLPDRRNIVLTRRTQYDAHGAEVFPDFDAALEACGGSCFVIGGGETYADALSRASRVFATEIESDCEGDAFFPELAQSDWRCTEQSARFAENEHQFVFRVYERST